MLCLYLAAQALNAYFVLIRVISTKDERVDDLMRAHLVYNAPAASLRSADNCAISFHKKQRKVLSEQSTLISTIRVCQTLTYSNEKLQTQYCPLLEIFYFLFLWALWGRSLLSWVPSMLCTRPTKGETSHPRESVLKVKARPLQWLLLVLQGKSYRARKKEKKFQGAVPKEREAGNCRATHGILSRGILQR